eukprot:CCRYP_003587-RA/>CCRYP_003587-RA protein AED:0.02 eAED:0.02 QI:106/1/1/1/0.5/0.33/3/1949/628
MQSAAPIHTIVINNENSLLLGDLSSTNSVSLISRKKTNLSEKKPLTAHESTLRFLLLPAQLFTVLLLEFLTTFRSYGLRVIIFNYITNEFSISDSRAGELLGIKSIVDIGVGLCGCILVDIWGVRKLSLVALAIASVSRALMAFGRSEEVLYVALFLFSPLGDALLSIGLYRVALKKLTTPITRPMAFAVSYAVQNFAGVCVALSVDWMRRGVDIRLNSGFKGIDGVYTPVRQFVVVTWLVVLATFAFAFYFLQDLTVIDPDDPDDDMEVDVGIKTFKESTSSNGNLHQAFVLNDANEIILQSATPICDPKTLERLYPLQCRQNTITLQFKGYKVFNTVHSKTSVTKHSALQSFLQFLKQLFSVLRIRKSWRVIAFSFCSVTVALQWTASDISLPPFLERRFGEQIPIYTIQNIHMMGCMILPPIVGAMTTGTDDFDIIMPGLWIMAVSPVMLVILPNVIGACAWQVVLTIGQVLWAPRQDSWTASLAPTGMEGLFFAVSCSRALLVPLGDFAMGIMNAKYNTNCPQCRDRYGHFCDTQFFDGVTVGCESVQESCELHLTSDDQTCPSTCNECPTWEYSDPSALWYILMVVSIISPLLVWCFLPFLRGEHNSNGGRYRIFSRCLLFKR